MSSPLGRLAWRLALKIGLAGLAAFALISIAALMLEHAKLQRQAAEQARQWVDSARGPLAAALWQFDRDSLTLLAQSLVRDGSITRVQVVDERASVLLDQQRAGTLAHGPGWEVPLTAPGQAGVIGQLRVFETPMRLMDTLNQQVTVLLLAEALKIALVVALVVWLVHRTLASPLRKLAADVSTLSLDAQQAPVTLQRAPTSTPDELDELVAVINRLHAGQVRELQQRIAAEQREREQVAERALILASVADGVLAFDRRGDLLYANAAAEELLEHQRGMTSLFDTLVRAAGDDRSFWQVAFGELKAQTRQTQLPAQRRLRQTLRRRDGSAVPAEISLTALPSGPLGYVAVLRDVSADVAAEQAIAESRAARIADRAKSEFLALMSHELRTPLNAVLGFSELLLEPEQPLNPPQRQWVEHVQHAGGHLLRLVSDLLDLSRIETGQLALALRPCAVQPLVGAAVALISSQASSRSIKITWDGTDHPAAVACVDATRFIQVMTNLLSNAVKYNRDGGCIHVAVNVDTSLVVRVSDTGLGLSDVQQAALFTPFNRLGRERTEIEGTGLGLVIAQQLMQLMGGALSCTSVPDEGSTFSLQLPLVGAILATAAPAATSAPPAAGPDASAAATIADAGPDARRPHCDVLVVEDNEVNQLLVQLYLDQRPAVQARYAASVPTAVALLQEKLPQLALIDLSLGAQSGTLVLQALRNQPRGDSVHCIAWSAGAMPGDIDRALAAGFDAYWIKPMGLKAFLEHLDAAVQTSARAH